MQHFHFRQFIPHLAAVLIFICLIFAYFPELLSKKTLRMDDIEQHKGMSNELVDYRERTGDEAIWTNTMFGGMPGYLVSVVYKGNLIRYVGSAIKLGLPRPADSMFVLMLGMYILLLTFKVKPPQAMLASVAYCFSTYNLLIMEAGHMSKVDAISWIPWVVAGMMIIFEERHWVGGLITAIFLSLQIKSGHFQVTYYLGFILAFILLSKLIDAIIRKNAASFGKGVSIFLLAGILGVTTNISSLYTIYDYGKDSIRGKSELSEKIKKDAGGLDKDYALDYSYGVGETFSYMIPNVYGGASNLSLGEQKSALKNSEQDYREIISQMPQYWSDTSTTGPFYAGAILCFFCVLGFFLVKGTLRWAILGAMVLAFLLSWGKNAEGFSVFMLNNFPMYNKFRAVKMTLIISDFLIPLMAILGLNEVVKNPEILQQKRKEFFLSFGLTGGLCLLFYLMPDTFFSFDYLNPQIRSQLGDMLMQNGMDKEKIGGWMSGFTMNLEEVRISVFKADAIRSFLFIALAGFLIWLYARIKFNTVLLTALVGLLILGDLFSVDKRYVNKKDFVSVSKAEIPFEPSVADEGVFSSEVTENKGLNAKIEQYQQLYSRQKDKGSLAAAEEAKYRFRGLLANTNYRVLNLSAPQGTFNDAGTSFFHKSIGGYSAAKLERFQELREYHLDSNINALYGIFKNPMPDSLVRKEFRKLYALNMLNTKYIIYDPLAQPLVNKEALGNAWFVEEIKLVNNADEEIKALRGFDPAKTALVDKRFSEQLKGWSYKPDSAASIQLKSYAPNKLEYTFNSSTEQMAVFSEVYYGKGWNAYIDGKETPHFRANYLLRAMKLPAGKHQIEFRFEPETYYFTEKISYASSGILLVLAIILIYFNIRKTDRKIKAH